MGLIRRNGRALAIVALALGLCGLLSSDSRWSATVWYYALQVPGAPPSWGAAIFTAGALLLWGSIRDAHQTYRRYYHVGAWIACVWCCAVDGLQLFALIHDQYNTANPMGVVVWTYLAYIYRERVKLSDKRSYD